MPKNSKDENEEIFEDGIDAFDDLDDDQDIENLIAEGYTREEAMRMLGVYDPDNYSGPGEHMDEDDDGVFDLIDESTDFDVDGDDDE